MQYLKSVAVVHPIDDAQDDGSIHSDSDISGDTQEQEQEEPEEVSVDSLNHQYRKWLTFRRISDVVLLITELVGLACVAWPAALQLQAGGGLAEAASTRQLQVAKDGLIYYDEVLTTSARLCALSGRPEFDVIYNNAVPLLEENLNEVLELRPGQAELFSAKTAAANEGLISLETEALRGCARGPQRLGADESAALVMGLEYEVWKGDYSYGIQLLATDIDNYISDARAEGWRQTVYLWTVGIVVMMLLAVAQAAINLQEEQSGKLAARFQDHLDRIKRSRLLRSRMPQDTRVLATWGMESGTLTEMYEVTADKDKEGDPSSPNGNEGPPHLFPMHIQKRKGFFSRLARALSPRGMILRKKYPMSTARMSSDASLLRKNMPRLVFLVHLVALGCLLTPPFIQIHTDGLVRMGHWLSDITALVHSIRYYDEMLTGSARLCALTGDARWMARYLENVGKIDVAIMNLISRQEDIEDMYPHLEEKFGGNLGEFFIENTDAANKRLIEIEDLVIKNCTGAFLTQNQDLFSPEYQYKKVILMHGLEKVNKDFVRVAQAQEDTNASLVTNRYNVFVIALVVLRVLAGLMFAYYYTKLNWLDDKVKVGSIRKTIRDGKRHEAKEKALMESQAAAKAKQSEVP